MPNTPQGPNHATNFKMSTENFVLSADSVTAEKPVLETITLGMRNFFVSDKSLKVRTLGHEQTFTIQLDAINDVDLFHINNTNFLPDTAFRITAYRGAALIYDSGEVEYTQILPLGDYGVYWGFARLGDDPYVSSISSKDVTIILNTPITIDKIVIEIVSPTADSIDVSKILISKLFTPFYNIAYGASLQWENTNSIMRVASGGAHVSRKYSLRIINVELQLLHDYERDIVSRILGQYAGLPVFITCYPGVGGLREKEYSGIFVISNKPSMIHQHYAYYAAQSLVFEEM